MGFEVPEYTADLERVICEWITINLKEPINSYANLMNGFTLTELLGKIDPNRFDIRQLWRLNEGNKGTEQEAFSWNNLAVFEEYLKKIWEDETKKNIFDFIEIDFERVFKDKDVNIMHKLVCIVFLTIIMLSKIEAALDLIQSINQLQDSAHEKMQAFAEECVNLYSQINPESKELKNESTSPYAQDDNNRDSGSIVQGSTLSRDNSENKVNLCDSDMFMTHDKHIKEFGKNDIIDNNSRNLTLLEKVDNYERDMLQLKESEALNKRMLKEFESKNKELNADIFQKDEELISLRFQIEDFKKKANVGLLEYYELELKQKDEKLKEMTQREIENHQEYLFKQREYMDQIEQFKQKISGQDSVKQKYEKKKSELKLLKDTKNRTTTDTTKMEEMNMNQLQAQADLDLERQKFKNLQEKAIQDKERCVELELKLTQQEMNANSNNIASQEKDLQIENQGDKINSLQNHIDKVEQEKSPLTNEEKVANLGQELSEYYEKNIKSSGSGSGAVKKDEVLKQVNPDTIEKMIVIDKTIQNMRYLFFDRYLLKSQARNYQK